jgi:hypothetical protein
MWLCGCCAPISIRIFRSIGRFRERHLDALGELFVQALRLCKKGGLVGLGVLAVDGTKPRANASRHKAMSYERMDKKEAQLEREIAALHAQVDAVLADAQATDAAEDEASAPTGAVMSCPTSCGAARRGWRGSVRPRRRLRPRPRRPRPRGERNLKSRARSRATRPAAATRSSPSRGRSATSPIPTAGS